MIALGQTQPTQGSFLVQPAGTFKTPAQPKEKTPIDWNSVLTGATNFATAYFGYRAATKGAAPEPSGQPPYTPYPTPTGMSNTTKTLLIGGGILVAGLIIYSLTKKK